MILVDFSANSNILAKVYHIFLYNWVSGIKFIYWILFKSEFLELYFVLVQSSMSFNSELPDVLNRKWNHFCSNSSASSNLESINWVAVFIIWSVLNFRPFFLHKLSFPTSRYFFMWKLSLRHFFSVKWAWGINLIHRTRFNASFLFFY